MKKTVTLLLALLLVLSLTGCSTMVSLIGAVVPDEETPTHTPEPNDTAISEIPADDAASDPIAEPEATPEPTPEPPIAEIEAALGLYHTLFETGLSRVSDGIWQLNACDVLAADPATYSPHGYNPLYWMDGFVLYDLDSDYIPELILVAGEVERQIYIFKPENGKLVFKSSALSGNQDEINYALEIYMDAEGNVLPYTAGTTGSGACDLDFVDRILPDLSVDPFLRRYRWPEGDEFSVSGEDVEMEVHKQTYKDHFMQLRLLEKVPFTAFGEDPMAALEEAMHG